jgi:hypothetical protein
MRVGNPPYSTQAHQFGQASAVRSYLVHYKFQSMQLVDCGAIRPVVSAFIRGTEASVLDDFYTEHSSSGVPL